jgi:phosphatidylglycerol:prolipoprotein diacylglycerol transferase
LDIATPAIPLFHFFGRMGCFFAGCCFGIESSFGYTFRYSIIKEANGINRFPVQLLEALVNLLLFFIKDILTKKLFQTKYYIFIFVALFCCKILY